MIDSVHLLPSASPSPSQPYRRPLRGQPIGILEVRRQDSLESADSVVVLVDELGQRTDASPDVDCCSRVRDCEGLEELGDAGIGLSAFDDLGDLEGALAPLAGSQRTNDEREESESGASSGTRRCGTIASEGEPLRRS